jgi:predicted enzyme related to lactoylglutathione lyase
MPLLINIDVPDLQRGIAFYTAAFGLTLGRRFGNDMAELTGWPAPVYLLRKDAGTIGAGTSRRSYDRHWTPVHLDVVVGDIGRALSQATAGGAAVEQDVRTEVWGKIALLADPFGHGVCLIEFVNRGYDELLDRASATT